MFLKVIKHMIIIEISYKENLTCALKYIFPPNPTTLLQSSSTLLKLKGQNGKVENLPPPQDKFTFQIGGHFLSCTPIFFYF